MKVYSSKTRKESSRFHSLLAPCKFRHQTSCSISATLGTLCRETPAKAAIISICYIALQQINFSYRGRGTHALLNHLNILLAHANTSRSTQMPPRLSLQILDHDTGQHDQLGVDIVQYLAIREVETISDVSRLPIFRTKQRCQPKVRRSEWTDVWRAIPKSL